MLLDLGFSSGFKVALSIFFPQTEAGRTLDPAVFYAYFCFSNNIFFDDFRLISCWLYPFLHHAMCTCLGKRDRLTVFGSCANGHG